MIIAKEEILRYLACARELQCESPWIDAHVSPFEVIFNSFQYRPNSYKEGIYSIDNSSYNPPSVGPLRVEADLTRGRIEQTKQETGHLSTFLYRKVYAHIGSGVLGDQMKLSGIHRSLLLPVLHPESNGETEMELVNRCYGQDERFLLGYCIPNQIENTDIISNIKSAISRYKIKAIKVHPNITGINLSLPAGKARIEAILHACQEADLPLIIHGGVSPVIKNSANRGFSSLPNLARINWGITKKPVVISHAGMMGASPIEIENDLLSPLKSILSSNYHVMIDISALSLSALCLILKKISPERIVFGSDFYYFSQWGAIAKLLHAIKLTSTQIEDRFLQIVARNSACIISQGG